jgi:hypothetical protein
MMLPLAFILLTILTGAYILSPLVRRIAAPLSDGSDLLAELRELFALRDVTYETIRDLEFDYHAGKIDQRDFQDLSGRHRLEALRVVERIEELEARIPRRDGRRRNGA